MALSTSIRCFIFLAVQLTLLVSPLRGAPISISDFFVVRVPCINFFSSIFKYLPTDSYLGHLYITGFKMSRTGSMKEPVEAPVILTEVEEPGHASTWGRELHPIGLTTLHMVVQELVLSVRRGGPRKKKFGSEVNRPIHSGNTPRTLISTQFSKVKLNMIAVHLVVQALVLSVRRGNLARRLEDYVWTPEDFDRWLNPGHIPAQSETHSAPLLNNASPRQETLSIASPVAKQQPISV
ncbi:hypothetical protein PSTT_10826 [Puccinia striiformis]|uniref:Uncharacterized protein n=1 Tax=Puccinia striiformis TaxID=27350 RepID=A0A2S4V2S6_9BASI|nr:hypothetical protein PSTT_10826 [Puccinia striiformis]